MRAWLLQGTQGEDPGGLRTVLRQLADRPANAGWRLDLRPIGADLVPQALAQRPELVVFAAALSPLRSWVEEILNLDVGIIVSTDEEQSEAYRDLAERYPVLVASAQPSCEEMALAVRGIRAACCRQQYWKAQVEQLQQRLNDRIVIERAKGVLVQRLGIGEEEAYKRLRVLSRRQRRQIRDIAQSLLDTQALLLPPTNGYAGPETVSGEPPPPPDSSEAPPVQ
jgi:AmiR/NasT family two-component response regulator